jgi:outer membrane lipoprotein-sorting protein
MKQITSAVVIGVGLTVGGFSGLTIAGNPSFFQPAKATPAAPTLLSQLTSKLDLALLAKSSAVFVKSDRYRTESEIRVKATSGGTDVTSLAKVMTLAQAPNQFRAEITFPSDTGTEVKSTVVSDGKQVWMYRSDLKQYAVTPYEKFDDLDDYYWIGMSSYWFLSVPTDVRKPIAEGALADPQVLKELGINNTSPLKGNSQTLDGRSLYSYEYTDKEGFTIAALIEPTTAELKQIRLTGKSEGFNIDIAERILTRTANPAIAASTFKFTPPLGAKLVQSVEIGPL